MQSRIEHYIDDYGLRRMMVRAHRQAWVWQDEWIGLTIKDIRRLERETQIILRKKLGKAISDDEADGEEEDSSEEETTLNTSTANVATESKAMSTSNGNIVSGNESTTTTTSHLEGSPAIVQVTTEQKEASLAITVATTNTSLTAESSEFSTEHTRHSIDVGELMERRRKSASLRHKSLKRNSRSNNKRQSSLPDNKLDITTSTSSILPRRRMSSSDSEYLPCCGLDAVAIMNISSDDEYYDAVGEGELFVKHTLNSLHVYTSNALGNVQPTCMVCIK